MSIETSDETIYRCFDIETYQVIAVDNDKKGLINLGNFEQIQLNYYKTIVDSKNTYIYFIFKDLTDITNYNYRVTDIIVNKLIINNEVYDIEAKTTLYGDSQKIFYISIPRSNVRKINQASISFIASQYINNEFTSHYITNQMSFNVD